MVVNEEMCVYENADLLADDSEKDPTWNVKQLKLFIFDQISK